MILKSDNDKITVIGVGGTLHKALITAETLSQQHLFILIIDPFTIKPLAAATIISNVKDTGGRFISVEDHCREDGLGEAVCATVAREPDIFVHQMAVSIVPK